MLEDEQCGTEEKECSLVVFSPVLFVAAEKKRRTRRTGNGGTGRRERGGRFQWGKYEGKRGKSKREGVKEQVCSCRYRETFLPIADRTAHRPITVKGALVGPTETSAGPTCSPCDVSR